MSMKATQSSKSITAHSHTLEVRQYDAVSISNNHVLDIAVTVHKYANLPMNLVRRLRKLARKFLCNDLPRWDSPLEKLFEAMNVVWLESLKIPVDITNGLFLHCTGC